MTKTARIYKIEDFEGDGTCSACGREGLRWIATLTDGTRVGLECAKRVTGIKAPSVKGYEWTAHFEAIAEHDERDGSRWVLWQHRTGAQTRSTRDGILHAVGGARQEWEAEGWL